MTKPSLILFNGLVLAGLGPALASDLLIIPGDPLLDAIVNLPSDGGLFPVYNILEGTKDEVAAACDGDGGVLARFDLCSDSSDFDSLVTDADAFWADARPACSKQFTWEGELACDGGERVAKNCSDDDDHYAATCDPAATCLVFDRYGGEHVPADCDDSEHAAGVCLLGTTNVVQATLYIHSSEDPDGLVSGAAFDFGGGASSGVTDGVSAVALGPLDFTAGPYQLYITEEKHSTFLDLIDLADYLIPQGQAEIHVTITHRFVNCYSIADHGSYTVLGFSNTHYTYTCTNACLGIFGSPYAALFDLIWCGCFTTEASVAGFIDDPVDPALCDNPCPGNADFDCGTATHFGLWTTS